MIDFLNTLVFSVDGIYGVRVIHIIMLAFLIPMLPSTIKGIKEIFTDESRTSNPAWELRGLEQNNMAYLHFNPQEKIELPFTNNLNTRMLEKDYYTQ